MAKSEQKFVAHRAKEAGFKPGLRSYLEYRDLGVAEATGGRFLAHVIRPSGPRPEQPGGVHLHDLDFQMNYVTKGWVRMLIEGRGELVFNVGDSWVQPPRIKHDFIACSDDAEWIEITSPAEFPTHKA